MSDDILGLLVFLLFIVPVGLCLWAIIVFVIKELLFTRD